MFLLSNVCGSVPNLFLSRAISCSSSCNNRNHYVTLGITPAASQEDIKRAYFELCKKYHPDKNDGSVESTKMFRIITEAYEVLGNEKLRQAYDDKMCYGRGARQEKWNVNRREDYSYEAERFFYERTKPRKTYTGKTWQYDFDAWTRAHYPKIKEENLRKMRDRRRNWRNFDPNEPGNTYKSGRSSPFFIFHLGVIIALGCAISVLPVVGFESVGISKRRDFLEDDVQSDRTQSKKNNKCDTSKEITSNE